jgi:Rrf2 family transcriptional regulator, cysteine metabolism repressor
MKLSTRTRYGIRAVIELAQHEGDRPLQLKTIAERQDISIKYLEQLMGVLRAAGLIRSVRGARGGYVLARQPAQITLYEVFRCLEGPVTTTECVEDAERCERSADCAARKVWMQLEEAIRKVLTGITLADVIQQPVTAKAEYQI